MRSYDIQSKNTLRETEKKSARKITHAIHSIELYMCRTGNKKVTRDFCTDSPIYDTAVPATSDNFKKDGAGGSGQHSAAFFYEQNEVSSMAGRRFFLTCRTLNAPPL